MTAATDRTARNKLIVGAFYDGGARGDLAGFGARLHPEFVVEAPDYLSWRGAHGPEAYLRTVLPQAGAALDFTRFRYVSITAKNDRVVEIGFASAVAARAFFESEGDRATDAGQREFIQSAGVLPVTSIYTFVRDTAITTAGLRGSRSAQLIEQIGAANQTQADVTRRFTAIPELAGA